MRLRQHFLTKQFVLFLVVGTINTFSGVLFSSIFAMWIPPAAAFVVGYCCSLFFSYLLNSYFVFKHKLALLKFIKFILSYIPNFIIQFICVVTLLNMLNINAIIVYAIAAVIGVPITFLLMKLFTFNNQQNR